MNEHENNVILAALKLARAMRRCPPPQAEHPFPPALGRLLACIAENRHASPRDLCEYLDLRPSSLSEMLARAESDGWIIRTPDEEDRRVQRVDLSAKGEAFIAQMEEARKKDLDRRTSCFTEEEKAQFCALSNKLSEHLESMAVGLPPRPPRGPLGPRGPRGGPGFPKGPGFPGGPDFRGGPGFPDGPGFPEPPAVPEVPEFPDPPEASGPAEEADGAQKPVHPFLQKGRIRC